MKWEWNRLFQKQVVLSQVIFRNFQKLSFTGLAWDNFDINTETPSDADTIHHTYGICYQNIDNNKNAENIMEHTCHAIGTKRKIKDFQKVKKTTAIEDIEPYWKKPKHSTFDFSVTSIHPTNVFTNARNLDLLWAMIINLSDFEIPMWVGWNTLATADSEMKQRVCYMKHIQLPPNRVDVVRETLKRLQVVSRECRQMYTIVTYDLAIAKIAKQIQSEDFPQFDDVYIMFAAFHIILNIFFSVGKIIEGSGGPYVLSEAKIVAPGPINQFPKGKMYNRWKRGHTLLAVAFHGLHLAKFIEDMREKDNFMSDL